jgi:hypothetical protein
LAHTAASRAGSGGVITLVGHEFPERIQQSADFSE